MSVEVYFLLYLSAIILLLGTTPGHDPDTKLESTVMNLLAPDFRVQVERPALVWRFAHASLHLDSAQVSELRRDSINVISVRGNVTDVRPTIVAIEDTVAGTSLPIGGARLVRMAGRDRAWEFRWPPRDFEPTRSSVFRVTVVATARPSIPADLHGESRRVAEDVLARYDRLRDSVSFTVNVIGVDESGALRVADAPVLGGGASAGSREGTDSVPSALSVPPLSSFSSGDFSVNVARPAIYLKPGERWHNTIYASGNASVQWDVLSDDVVREQTAPTLIRLSGSAPEAGTKRTVTVQAHRASDGVSLPVSFDVITYKLAPPTLPASMTMFRGQSYTVAIGSGTNAPVRLEIREGSRMLLSRDQRRSSQSITPVSGDSIVVSYVDDAGAVIDSWTVGVEPLPLPNVVLESHTDREAIVSTTSYGTVDNAANRAALKVAEGNASDPERIGQAARDGSDGYVQRWRVRRMNNDRPFVFTVYATDLRGSSGGQSANRTFNCN